MTTFEKTDFLSLQGKLAKSKGLVLLDVNTENLDEWVDGITHILKVTEIVPQHFQFDAGYLLSTVKGRQDLVLTSRLDIDSGKLAMWCFDIGFGFCSILSTYAVNYANQHGVMLEMNGLDFDEED